ncbi:EMYY motif lipoprotein [Staphylococcus gallinarum]|uniref:Lipoprotein n=2 Tax=Staphylococcus gallinarum TaxID=1293 RepID=A0A0D0QZH5_STAGA|nr:EMYY motif lipoprotein [Staphylococcus gallinarum]KIR12516.1 lipoprotein [Staphylococcus gallinarum]MCD8786469.1 EMYY motif lipoprotein [Staphylococcus gallinarum]MCD8843671.1 EMYY motif lipoprotein [Staphylococcus gallinarum]MCD8859487.1 EMYY motif lipoprotein [Staphylococcus gallinarum]MCD8900296.1 EMYY motif lipoprotein [Staphylococcus gallinarum]
MKRILCIVLLLSISIILTSCSHKWSSEFRDFNKSLNDVKNKGKNVEEAMDSIQLKRLDDLSKTDTTDKNKQEFNDLQNKINSKVIPKMDAYEKAAKHLPAKSAETKALKSEYLEVVQDKKKALNQTKKFVDLYNQSIKANEDILDYTKLFEKNRSQVEANMKKAKKAGATSDVKYFEEKLEENNKALKSTVDDGFDSSDPQKVKKLINDDIMPLITKEIRDLNKTEITSGYVNDARKNAIEMYYSLQNYYETREETIEISEKIEKMDIDALPKEGKDLERYDKAFNKKYKKIKDS